MPQWVHAAILIAAILIAIFSFWLSIASIRTLGKQWTYVARVIEGHRLITEGPYNWVRNPIYLAMFGSLVSTGLVFSKWWAFFPAIVIFLIGTQIRISREEKLLSATFGQEWSDYTRNHAMLRDAARPEKNHRHICVVPRAQHSIVIDIHFAQPRPKLRQQRRHHHLSLFA